MLCCLKYHHLCCQSHMFSCPLLVSSPVAPTSAMTTSSPSPTSVCGRCSSFLSPAHLWWWWLMWNSVKERMQSTRLCIMALTCTPTLARREAVCGGPTCWVWSSKLGLTQPFSTFSTGYTMDMTCPRNAHLNTAGPGVYWHYFLTFCSALFFQAIQVLTGTMPQHSWLLH